jgi:hypothetical protein
MESVLFFRLQMVKRFSKSMCEVCLPQWPHGVALECWDRGFKSHWGHGCVCRQWPYVGLIPYPRSPTDYAQYHEAQQRDNVTHPDKIRRSNTVSFPRHSVSKRTALEIPQRKLINLQHNSDLRYKLCDLIT